MENRHIFAEFIFVASDQSSGKKLTLVLLIALLSGKKNSMLNINYRISPNTRWRFLH